MAPQESDVHIENDEQMQGSHSTAQPVGFQLQLPSRRENTLLASPDNPLTQDLTDFDFLFGEIDSLQAVEQAIQRWSPFQKSSIHVNYNEDDAQLIKIQYNDSTAATSSELQRQPELRPEDLFGPFLTGFNELHSPVQTPVPGASHSWMEEERSGIGLVNDNLTSQDRTDFNVGYNAKNEQIQPESRQENSFPTGSGKSIYMSDTSVQTPLIDGSRPWTAAGRNDMDFKRDSLPNQDWTDFNFQRQPVGENEYSQPGQVLLRVDIPPTGSGAAGPPTSLTVTIPPPQSSMEPSAAWPHLTADDAIRNVGSSRIRQASASRRKKGGIHRCPVGNCDGTFTAAHNLQYHLNSHQSLTPYQCNHCSYAAACPSTLKRHSKKQHQNVQVEPYA